MFISQRNNTINSISLNFKNLSQSILLPKISRLINKYLYKYCLGSSINRYNNTFTLYSSRADKKLYEKFSSNDRFINFGSGTFFHHYWSNYDYPGQTKYYQSLQGIKSEDFNPIDLCDPNLLIPESNNSVTLIYCSHTLEHLDALSAKRFLSECSRILVKGGVLRIVLPNTKNDFLLLQYLNSQSTVNIEVIKLYTNSAVEHMISDSKTLSSLEISEILALTNYDSTNFYTEIIRRYSSFAIFDGANPDRHISYWDFNSLIKLFSTLNFSYCTPCYQGSSASSPFTNIHVFDNTEAHIAIYIDIIK